MADLTTLENVKAWLNTGQGPFPGGDDRVLARLITAASAWVPNYLSRAIAPAQYTEKYNGLGTPQLFLRQRPVLSVASLVADTTTVAPSSPAPLASGYVFDDSSIYLTMGQFPRGFQNVTVSYVAGLQATQTVAVPTNGQPMPVTDLSLPWNTDRGVSYVAFGTSLSLVASSPGAGQYALQKAANGNMTYLFNAVDGSQSVIITYGYTPFDLEQVVVELVGETYKRRTRIGQDSQAMGNGQTVSFSTKVLNAPSLEILNQFRNVVPA